jgi:hypothetical protein
MALESIDVSLRAWRPDLPPSREVFEMLGITDDEAWRCELHDGPGTAALVSLARDSSEEHSEAANPQHEVQRAITSALRSAGDWIRARPSGAFQRCRDVGYRVDVVMTGWINEDQFDLDLPNTFLASCAEAGLDIRIVTND